MNRTSSLPRRRESIPVYKVSFGLFTNIVLTQIVFERLLQWGFAGEEGGLGLTLNITRECRNL